MSISSQCSLLSLSRNMFLFTESEVEEKKASSTNFIPCRFLHNLVVGNHGEAEAIFWPRGTGVQNPALEASVSTHAETAEL